MQPLVSVIMPAYNGEKYIAESINSVISQTYENWELIVIDDASTDLTYDILNTYNDERIHILKNDKNMGISYTTNRAIGESKGKYIALLDDDDNSLPNRLELQVSFLESNEDIDVLGGGTIYIDESGKMIGTAPEPRKNPLYFNAMLLLTGVDFANSTVMIKKSFLLNNNIEYRTECYGMQDMRFYIECSKVGNISSIQEFVLEHRLHSNNETKRILEINGEQRKRKYAEFQRYSFERSGFVLRDEWLDIINRIFAEHGGVFLDRKDFENVYMIFVEVINQAKQKDVSYVTELQHFLRKKFMEKARLYEPFFEEHFFEE